MQRVIGSATWGMLLNRPLLSVLCAVYAFQNTESVRELWRSKRRELMVLLGLLPFCRRDLRTKPSGFVYASDACPSGFAVAKAVADPLDVREIRAVDERWRLHEVGHGTARSEALSSELSVSPPDKLKRGFKPPFFQFPSSPALSYNMSVCLSLSKGR